MKDICELCSLCSPNMGCTKLENESCLKEALKNVKPSVTNGEMIKTMFPKGKIIVENTNETIVVWEFYEGGYQLPFKVDWWNRKWGE